MSRQFVIAIGNQPGELAHLCRALATRGINIEHVWCVGEGGQACVFVVPDDAAAMSDVLHCTGYKFIEGDPLVVDVPDRPGGLADLADRLAGAGVNILGTLDIGRRPGVIEMAFTVDNLAAASAALGREPVTAGH
jgi:hypothetical protein